MGSAGLLPWLAPQAAGAQPLLDPATARDWLARWEPYILSSARRRYCDREVGEGVGWRVSPFLNGFYYGYRATRDPKWLDLLVDWADSWIRRGVPEPDGFTGWPAQDPDGPGSGGIFAGSLLGEAMALRPLAMMAAAVLGSPALQARWGAPARRYLELARRTFDKWNSRGAWRAVEGGGVWVEPGFGIDRQTGKWTAAFERRAETGLTHPDNKQNLIALWLLALADATGERAYADRAAEWFRLMRSRLQPRQGGRYLVWNYWEPAGPWDYKPDGSTRHWVGVHPNGGYYRIDVSGMAAAFEHRLVFTREEIDRLIATNRDFMWNRELRPARFQRIDGGPPDPRWKDSPGLLWTELAPWDETLRNIFLANHNPASWDGLGTTPYAAAA